ncbi:MAG: Sau3AI family type II restriction endonuclease [Methylococcaceae bacterium]
MSRFSDINKQDANAIIAFAKRLENKTLRQVCGNEIISHGYLGKGNFGQILEKFYFEYQPNSNADADFKEAGLELKSSPLKIIKTNEFHAKERLVLNIINYFEIVNQNFYLSSFWLKNAHLLLIFYHPQKDKAIFDYLIKLVGDWQFPIADLAIIKKDWELIKTKVVAGKAHELSEGDTFYLGACTKGGKGGNPKGQPNSDILAKQRAYSLKRGYVNHIVASIAGHQNTIYGKLLDDNKEQDIELLVIAKFKTYYGKTTDEIITSLAISLNTKAKSFYANLTKAILGIELNKEIAEFEKADIVVKTIRLKQNNLPKEDISFPTFKYTEIVKETWEESEFKQLLEHKFFFVFYQKDVNEQFILKKVKFWNMSYEDTQKVKTVWLDTIKRIENGQARILPKKSEHSICHVRPHAQNANDTYETPQGDYVVKKCFWLNSQYIRDEVYLKN